MSHACNSSTQEPEKTESRVQSNIKNLRWARTAKNPVKQTPPPPWPTKQSIDSNNNNKSLHIWASSYSTDTYMVSRVIANSGWGSCNVLLDKLLGAAYINFLKCFQIVREVHILH